MDAFSFRKDNLTKSTWGFIMTMSTLIFMKIMCCYPPRSEGDNALGSVCLSVRPSVHLFALSRLNSALPSAAKSNESHCQSKVFVCVSLTSGRM